MSSGNVYCLSNPSMPGLLKFGRTGDTCSERAISLFTTGVPDPFKIEKYTETDDTVRLEKNIHTILSNYRNRTDREFFRINLDDAFALITKELPDLDWIDGEDYDYKSKSKITAFRKFTDEYNIIKSDADNFKTFMEEHKWFPNNNHPGVHMNNKDKYTLEIEHSLEILEKGILSRPDAIEKKSSFIKVDDKYMRESLKNIEKKSSFIKVDDKYMRESLKNIEKVLTSMKVRFKKLPDSSSICECYSCERNRNLTSSN